MAAVEEKKANPTGSPYSNIPGYDPNQPANSAQNRTAMANYQAGRATPTPGPPKPPTSTQPSVKASYGSDVPGGVKGETTYRTAVTPPTTTGVDRSAVPGYIPSGSPQNVTVREEEIKLAEERYKEGGFTQEGSSVDQFAKQRESALKSGSFDYKNYPGSAANKYYTPKNYLAPTGQRKDTNVQATAGTPNAEQKKQSDQRTLDDQLANIQLKLSRGIGLTPQEETIYHTATQQQRDTALFSSDVPGAVKGETTFTIGPTPEQVAKAREAPGATSTVTLNGKRQDTITVSSSVITKSNELRKQERLLPLEETVGTRVTAGTPDAQNTTIQQQRQPVIRISETELAKTDALRKQQGLQPLEKESSLLVYSYKAEPTTTKTTTVTKTSTEPTVNVSSSTLAKSDVLRKEEGLQPLEKTAPLAVTTYQTNKGVETKSTEYVQSDKIKQAVGAFLAPAAYLGLSVIAGFAKATGQTILGVKPGTTEADINLKIAKTFGTAETDQLGTLTSKESLAEKAPVLVGGGAFFGLGLVTGKEKLPGVKAGDANKVIQGVKATEEITPVSETTKVTTKQGTVTRFEQVGISKESEQNVKPEIKPVGELFGKIVSTKEVGVGPKGEEVKPKEIPVSPGAKTETITGIGPKGEAVQAGKVSKATLTQPEALGEPKIPLTEVGKQATTYLAGSTEKLEAQKFIALEISSKQAEELGATKLEGVARAYQGTITEGTLEKLSAMQKEGKLEELPFSFFKEPTQDVLKEPKLYPAAIHEPSLFERFTELTQPQVTKIFQGGGRYGLKGEKTEEEKPATPKDIFKEDKAVSIGEVEPRSQFFKPTQEEVESRYPLMTSHLEPAAITERLAGLVEERPVQRTATEPVALGTLQKGTVSTTEETILKTPPGYEVEKLKTGTVSIEKTDLGSRLRESETVTTLNKQVTDLISTQKEKTDLETNTGLKTETRLETGLITETSQVTGQKTQQVTGLVTKQTLETPPPEKTLLTIPPGTPTPKFPDKRFQFLEKPKKGKSKEKQEFVGNVPLEDIVGVRKRSEVTYGESARKLVSREFTEGNKSKTKLETSRDNVPFLKPNKNTFAKESNKDVSTSFKREKNNRKYKL